MFNFNDILMENEKILYEGKPTPGKGGKALGGILAILAFVVVWCGLLIWSVATKTGDGANGIDFTFIIMMLVGLAFGALAIYIFIYNVFIKKKSIADDTYCLTTLRALKYESKTNKLSYGFLIKYGQIEVQNEKDGYGDVYMGIVAPDNLTEEQQLVFIKENLFNKKLDDMPTMMFESIERPYNVMKIATEARDNLISNTNIQNN